jgi:hypothetical protein
MADADLLEMQREWRTSVTTALEELRKGQAMLVSDLHSSLRQLAVVSELERRIAALEKSLAETATTAREANATAASVETIADDLSERATKTEEAIADFKLERAKLLGIVIGVQAVISITVALVLK